MKDNFWLENFWKPNAGLILFLIILISIKVAMKYDFEFAIFELIKNENTTIIEEQRVAPEIHLKENVVKPQKDNSVVHKNNSPATKKQVKPTSNYQDIIDAQNDILY